MSTHYFSTLDYAERLKIIEYRNNLILFLMEIQGYSIAKTTKKTQITSEEADRHRRIREDSEAQARILNEIYILSLWIEAEASEKKYLLQEVEKEIRQAD